MAGARSGARRGGRIVKARQAETLPDAGGDRCALCGAAFVRDGIGTGYGIAMDGARHCYQCCANQERASMIETGRAVLYLVDNGGPVEWNGRAWRVTDWPGRLSFPARVVNRSRRGGGFGSQITTARFTGPDGRIWSAVNRGDSQIARCRRLVRP